jgi:hypothetical protein
MNPDRANKTFLTSSHDATVLVWDLRSDAAVVRPTVPPLHPVVIKGALTVDYS